MKRAILFLIVLIFAVWLGLQIRHDPGYMLIAYGHWTMEMPLWLGIIIIVVAFLLLHWLFKFIACGMSIPERYRFWRNRRKRQHAYQKTNRGLIAFAEGNWAAAEKLLSRAANMIDAPLINYLVAARAAQAQGAYDRRDNYLRQAHIANPDAEIAVELTQAVLQLEHQQLEQAVATLRHLRELVPHHRYVLKLLKQVYLQLNDWQALQEIFSALHKYRVFDEKELADLATQIYQHQFDHVKDSKALATLWHNTPRSYRNQPEIIYPYVKDLIQNHEEQKAEEILRDSLKKNCDDNLILLYADLENIDHKKQLQFAENLLKQHKNNALLLYALGKICLHNQLWGKARGYFEESIHIKPTISALKALGNLLEKQGDIKQAMECYKNAVVL